MIYLLIIPHLSTFALDTSLPSRNFLDHLITIEEFANITSLIA